MLSLLLDENISQQIALQLGNKRPDILVTSIHGWHLGRFISQPDELILAAAATDALTLVTYDQKTIMPLLLRWAQAGIEHGGVIFVDNRTIAPNDFGTLIRSLIAIWDSSNTDDWTNVVTYLRADT